MAKMRLMGPRSIMLEDRTHHESEGAQGEPPDSNRRASRSCTSAARVVDTR